MKSKPLLLLIDYLKNYKIVSAPQLGRKCSRIDHHGAQSLARNLAPYCVNFINFVFFCSVFRYCMVTFSQCGSTYLQSQTRVDKIIFFSEYLHIKVDSKNHLKGGESSSQFQ